MLGTLFRNSKSTKAAPSASKSEIGGSSIAKRLLGKKDADPAAIDPASAGTDSPIRLRAAEAAADALDEARADKASREIAELAENRLDMKRDDGAEHDEEAAGHGRRASLAGPDFREISDSISNHLNRLRDQNRSIQSFLDDYDRDRVTARQSVESPSIDPSAELASVEPVAEPEREAIEVSSEAAHEAPVYDSIEPTDDEGTAQFAEVASEEQHDRDGKEDAETFDPNAVEFENVSSHQDEDELAAIEQSVVVDETELASAEASEMCDTEAQPAPIETEQPMSAEAAPAEALGPVSSQGDEDALAAIERSVFAGQDETDGVEPLAEPASEPEAGSEPTVAAPMPTQTEMDDTTLSYVLMSQDAMDGPDENASELNAQVVDYLLFDVAMDVDEMPREAFAGWCADFFWRNLCEGGMARFSSLAMGRPDIWEGLSFVLQKTDAEPYSVLVDDLQRLLADNAELAGLLEGDPEQAAEDDEMVDLDRRFLVMAKAEPLPEKVGAWLKTLDDLRVMESEDLQDHVSTIAERPAFVERRRQAEQ